jgi:Cft2 family RNA processing exonuclease
MECTFGKPEFRFPPRAEVIPELADHLRSLLAAGRTPVLLAYALGRSQELLKELESYDLDFHLAPPIHGMVKVYEELGIEFGPYQLARTGCTGGGVLMVPPHASGSKLVKYARDPELIAATGWTAGGAPPYRADRCFPFSDHADFDELVEYAERAQPRQIFVINGYLEFCEHLRERGFRAYRASERILTR